MSQRRTTPKGYERARELRKNLTPAEQKLWKYLRGNQLKGVNFRRQHAIGIYIADFCSLKPKLVIELDGGQHTEQQEYDNARTAFLESEGYHVLRFWNNEVMENIEGVLLAIENVLDPHPASPKSDEHFFDTK